MKRINLEQMRQVSNITKEYQLLTEPDFMSVQKCRDFIKNAKQNVKALKEYIEFVDSLPFSIGEPVINSQNDTLIIKSLAYVLVEGNYQLGTISATDRMGKTETYSPSQLKKYKGGSK